MKFQIFYTFLQNDIRSNANDSKEILSYNVNCTSKNQCTGILHMSCVSNKCKCNIGYIYNNNSKKCEKVKQLKKIPILNKKCSVDHDCMEYFYGSYIDRDFICALNKTCVCRYEYYPYHSNWCRKKCYLRKAIIFLKFLIKL